MKAIILAAGKGKRLKSEEAQLPKALRKVNGFPLLHYVVNSVDFLQKEDIVIVVGFFKEAIMQNEEFKDYNFAIQSEQLGTGHAVKSAKEYIKGHNDDVLILFGDAPMVEKQTILNMYEFHKSNQNQCTILSCFIDKCLSLGRIVKQGDNFRQIVEDKDCNSEQKLIREYNASVMIADSEKLLEELENLSANNAQKEYYLTDIPKLFLGKQYKVGVYTTSNENEILGVNTQEDLELIESLLRNV